MDGWDIVIFKNDNSVEAVPSSWVRKNSCAWPKNSKHVKKCITKQIKPNPDGFKFYPARKIGNKTYDSFLEARSKLNKATYKSDFSTTEDEMIDISNRKKIKCPSLSPNVGNHLKSAKDPSNSCPPRYIPVKEVFNKKVEDSSKKITRIYNSNRDDDGDDNLSIDPPCNFNDHDMDFDVFQNDELEEMLALTPIKDSSQLKPRTIIDEIIITPVGKWSVEKHDDNSSNSKENYGMLVKKQLFIEDTTNRQKPVSSVSTVKHVDSSTKKSAADNRTIHMSISDFQTFVINTLTRIKYDISDLINVNQITQANVQILMDNEQRKSSNPISADNLDFEAFLPVTNHHELMTIENKIHDNAFRNSLVSKLSLLVGNKDLGNSVRRIMARVFDDHFLTEYSLYGFKKKSPFSKLLIYRVIIDALRIHNKYKLNTEKDIDIPLGTWLSHAPFRIKDKAKKQQTINIT